MARSSIPHSSEIVARPVGAMPKPQVTERSGCGPLMKISRSKHLPLWRASFSSSFVSSARVFITLGILNDPLRPVAGSTSNIEKAAQAAGVARVRKFSQRLRLDLADALAGDREALADLFERVVGIHADAEAHAHDVLFARGEAGEGLGRDPAQVGGDRRID